MGGSNKDGSGEALDHQGTGEELITIIDETGEGFGFDFTPQALAKPIAIGASALFSLGMLAGVPFGLAMGRAQEDGKGVKSAKVRPSLEGVKFAATTFGLGTFLCGAMGLAGFYGLKWYYDVESFDEFGIVMRRTVPNRRHEMETGLRPILDRVRKNAGDSLPGPMHKIRERFNKSRFGTWLKEQVDISVTLDESSDTDSRKQGGHPGEIDNGSSAQL